MKTCKTCKWWDKDGSRSQKHQQTQLCLCPSISSSASNAEWCPNTFNVTGSNAELIDGSGYLALLRTGPDFGCVHHEEA